MGFKEGNKFGKGRPKGSPNKDNETKVFIKKLIEENHENIRGELKTLKGKQFIDAMLSLMEYAVPKLQRVEVETDLDIKAEGITINYIKPKDK